MSQDGEIDLPSERLLRARLKVGLSTTHPLRSDEPRTISAWLKERPRMKPPSSVRTTQMVPDKTVMEKILIILMQLCNVDRV
jgi:hypothetical protein